MDEKVLDEMIDPSFDKDFDELVETIRNLLANASANFPNVQRIRDVAVVTDMMYRLDLGDRVKVTNSLPDISNGFAEVVVEGTSLEIFFTDIFQRAIKLANNFEVYPLENGKVRMAFGFYGLTTKVEEE